MLEIKNLEVAVGEKPILKGITLKVKKGEVHAIRERGVFGRRKETQRSPADGRAGAQALHYGRDRFGPGYRRPANRRARDQRHALAGKGLYRRHALSAAP